MIDTADDAVAEPPFVKLKSNDALRAARRAAHLTQVQLAKSAQVSQQYISHLETGYDEDCTAETATRIAAALNAPLEDLFAPRAGRYALPRTTSTRGSGNAREGSGAAGTGSTAGATVPEVPVDVIELRRRASAEYPDGDPRLAWSIGEVAALLRLPKRTVYAMRAAGELGAIKAGKHYRVPDPELVRLLKTGAARTTSAA
ncbi:helix-turn-helix domain-containing protein [Saccharothrix xinjiangensis]|uniref:Helix-turn-helix domain-containing protein n=1 Tax=Saccharothrix xinjiangensis TaxID=204798 RepID=A0ABV9XW66_9PSEU